MRQMEKSVRLRLAEKLDDKTEYSVAYHINGVGLSARFAFYYARADNRKQNDIKNQFCLPRRESRSVKARNRKSEATSGNNAVYSRAHDSENHTGSKNVEYFTHRALRDFCAQPVCQRHEKHSAEQTHISETRFVKPGFQKGKRFNREHSVDRVKYRERYCRIPSQVQPLPHQNEPNRSRCCTY